MMTAAFAPTPELRAIDAALTEKVFGWKWYTLTMSGREKALEQDQLDGAATRAHMLDGQRFLAEPRYGDSQVERGHFAWATRDDRRSTMYDRLCLPVSQAPELAILALQKCEYVAYHKTDQLGHRISCAVLMISQIGRAEASSFAEAVARAVFQAYDGIDVPEIEGMGEARRELREELVEEGHERGV